MSKKYLILLSIGFFLVTCAIIIIAVVNRSTTPVPTLTPTPTPSQTLPTVKKIKYNISSQEKLGNYLKNRTQLSETDRQARAALITSLNNQTATVMSTSEYTLMYIKSADMFLVEIKTPSITVVKQDIAGFFKEKGISYEGMCYLPLSFYLNPSTAQTLRNSNIQFNPLPLGC